MLMGEGRGLFSLSLVFSSSPHSLLTSDRAVDGPLSISSIFSFSPSSKLAASLVTLLGVLSLLLALALLTVLLAVLVLFKAAFPVWGGEVRQGETNDMLFRKSR